MRLASLFVAASFVVGGLGACHHKQELTPPPPPLRPEAEAKPIVHAAAEKDCEPTDPDHELKPLSFGERSIPEGQRLADQGKATLKAGTSAEVTRSQREDMITDAVNNDLITALKADPYNVDATYALAAAYSQIGRRQCALNLLQRLLQMRTHPSKHTEVENALDRLLGRKQVLDPDFSEMRKDERFRVLIMKMCESNNDANCVYGGQKDNRER
ncbi:MAG TPA: hypothetical protein VGM88_34350 [Kofleriaceae bacterium]|jgi:hypothetical protein